MSYRRQETWGYRLEKREDYQTPLPCNGNNFYKNHSQISKKNIYRKFKGPLYNDAGRICIELTQKYLPLETFKFSTQLDNM